MRPPQRIVWSEGMLISPQHLQQQDRYHEALLGERLRALSPHAWGVVELALDERALERCRGQAEIVVVPVQGLPRLRGAAALVTTPAFAAPLVAQHVS